MTAMAVSGGLLAAPHSLDSLRDPFQARLSQALGGDVRFGGIALHGWQGFRLTDLSVRIPSDEGEHGSLRATSAVIQLSPFDILHGRQGVHTIQLEGALFDVNLDGLSKQAANQVPGILQAFLETPGLSIRGRNGVMRVYDQAGLPPLILTNVEFDFHRPDGVEAVRGSFHAQLGNTPAERLDAHLYVDSERHFDVFLQGNRIGSRTITRVFPAASEYLLAGAFYPEVRITRFNGRWLMKGAAAFEGVEVLTPRHGFALREGTFHGAAAYSRHSRELIITHARLDSPQLRGSAHGAMRFTDEETEVDLEIDEVEFPPPLPADQLAWRQFGDTGNMTSERCPIAPPMAYRTIAGSR